METVKLLLLKNGWYVISYIEEMEMEPSCFLADPMEIIDGEFFPFPKYSAQRNVLLYSDFIATIVDPDPELLAKYQQVVPPQDDEEETELTEPELLQ